MGHLVLITSMEAVVTRNLALNRPIFTTSISEAAQPTAVHLVTLQLVSVPP